MSAVALPDLAAQIGRTELLSDRRGVYGCAFIGSELNAFGKAHYFELITRPDCLEQIQDSHVRWDVPVLQQYRD